MESKGHCFWNGDGKLNSLKFPNSKNVFFFFSITHSLLPFNFHLRQALLSILLKTIETFEDNPLIIPWYY